MDDLLRRQWEALTGWLRDCDLSARMGERSGLEGWTVADLVAHLGLGLSLASSVRATPEPAGVLSVAQYVAAYPPAAAEISAMTQRTRAEIEADPLGGLDAIGQRVWNAIRALDEPYVVARRGPIRRDDYLLTRLLELVVHGDDLCRALGSERSPVLPEALAVVSEALAAAYVEKTGRTAQVEDPTTWVRLATGRTPSDDPALPLL